MGKSKKQKKYYWLAVTPDEFETPIYIEEHASTLAKKLGISVSSVYTREMRGHSGKHTGVKIVKVERGTL